MTGRIHVDLFVQDNILNEVGVNIKLITRRDQFSFMGMHQHKVTIENAMSYIWKVKLS